MIKGRFNEYNEPCVQIQIADLKTEIIVDTGFNGALWLPLTLLTSLNLEMISTQRFFVADGHPVDSRVFSGKMTWFGKETEVEIIETESDNALLGTALLVTCSLFIHFLQKRVEIRKAKKVIGDLGTALPLRNKYTRLRYWSARAMDFWIGGLLIDVIMEFIIKPLLQYFNDPLFHKFYKVTRMRPSYAPHPDRRG